MVGERLLHDKRVPLISATGSTKMGRHVGDVVGERGRRRRAARGSGQLQRIE